MARGNFSAARARRIRESIGNVLSVEEVKKRHILNVLRRCEGNVTAAAEALCVDRSVLKNWLDGWGVKRGDEKRGFGTPLRPVVWNRRAQVGR
jgi:DNA-binding NtrC family response regulator